MRRSTPKELPRPRRSDSRGPGPVSIIGALFLIGFLGLVGLFIAHRMVNPRENIGQSITQMFNPIPDPQTLFNKDRLAILLLGIDYNYDAKDQEFSSGARSDTIMAMSLDLPTKSLHIISVPRDMEYTYADGTVDKINAAFTMGGPHAAEKAIASFLGIPGFDRYIVLRINATKALIDAIGGIDVPVTETLNYDDSWGHLHIHFTPGLTHMNGDQAVSYSRFRHDACSDPCRIKRQQQVMRLTIAKLKSDKFNDLAHITQLIDVVNQNVQSDLSTTERLSLASAYSSFSLANLQSDQIPYLDDRVVSNGGDVLIPDTVTRDRLVQKYFLAPVVLPGATADPAALAAIIPSHVHLQIENGSGVSGLGKHIADHFTGAGFVVDGVSNAVKSDYETSEIHVGTDNMALAQKLREEMQAPAATLATDEPASSDGKLSARIVVGRDAAVVQATATP